MSLSGEINEINTTCDLSISGCISNGCIEHIHCVYTHTVHMVVALADLTSMGVDDTARTVIAYQATIISAYGGCCGEENMAYCFLLPQRYCADLNTRLVEISCAMSIKMEFIRKIPIGEILKTVSHFVSCVGISLSYWMLLNRIDFNFSIKIIFQYHVMTEIFGD